MVHGARFANPERLCVCFIATCTPEDNQRPICVSLGTVFVCNVKEAALQVHSIEVENASKFRLQPGYLPYGMFDIMSPAARRRLYMFGLLMAITFAKACFIELRSDIRYATTRRSRSCDEWRCVDMEMVGDFPFWRLINFVRRAFIRDSSQGRHASQGPSTCCGACIHTWR